MKQTITLLLLLCFLLSENLHSQIFRLDISGNSILRGRIDARASLTDSTSVFIGRDAGINDDGTDNNNTALGTSALTTNTSGDFNTAIGHLALRDNDVGENNTAVGHLSLARNTEGESNTAIGFNSLGTNTMGSDNTAMGLSALSQNRLGDNNTALGRSALGSIRDGADNTGIGYNALAFGTSAASRNTAVGKESLFRTTSDGNVGVGWRTLYNNTSGGGNTAVGGQALLNNTGDGNTALGDGSMLSNTTGDFNTVIGFGANVGFNNLINATAIGYNTLVSRSNSLILGNNVNVGMGTSNPLQKLHIIGNRMRLATVGDAGKYIELRTDGNDVDISSTGARLFFNANNSDIVMQQSGDNTAIGNDTSPDYKLEVVGSAGKPGGGSWSNSSDRRLKKDIEDYEDGLKEVLKIRPVWYRYNGMYGLPTKERYVGVIAQEIQKIVSYTVTPYMETNDETGEQAEYLSYNGTAVTYMLVNAVQEQQAIIEEKEQKIKDLENRLAKIEDLLFGKTSNENNKLNITLTDAKLYANQPNPFTESTTLRYFIPSQVKQASLQITNANGAILKVIDIAIRGEGQTILEAQALSAGNYFYSLILDGKVLKTKQMVLVE